MFISSDFEWLKKFSAAALSKQLPFLDIEGAIPYCTVSLSYNLLVHWKPWPLCRSIGLSLFVFIFANTSLNVSVTSFKSLYGLDSLFCLSFAHNIKSPPCTILCFDALGGLRYLFKLWDSVYFSRWC